MDKRNLQSTLQSTLQYCSNCQRHTPHQNIVDMYASICDICHSHTSQLIRNQAEQYQFTAPDGTKAIVVQNSPDTVTFYIPTGDHQGYYHHNKNTGENKIVAG